MRQQIYLCARYARHEEMNSYASQLRELGYNVRAEWITGAHHDTNSAMCALIDLREVSEADIVISFTEGTGPVVGRGRGGRHVEFGAAVATGKRCIVVGFQENVFHYLPQVEFFETWGECLAALSLEVSS